MAEYGKLLSRIWSDPDFTALDARAQQVYCLLISYSSRNLAGVLPMTLKRWAKSTGDGTVENVTEALKALEAAHFIVVDWDTEEVLIRTYIRNDEVYRQPNLMKAARKFALQTESEALRWALHDELSRLPDPKSAGANEECASLLVNGLQRTPLEPFMEPIGNPSETLREPIPEPPGVGVSYVSGVREHQHLHPTPAPAAAATPIPEPPPPPRRSRDFTAMVGGTRPAPPPPDPGRNAAAAQALVDRVVDIGMPKAIIGQLSYHATKLLDDNTPAADVEAGLLVWITKPHLGPGALASCVAEAIKIRAAPAAPFGGRPGRASTKANDILAGAEQLIAARHAQPTHPQRAIEE